MPPETCPYNTGCNSVAVYFVSATVADGALCVLTLKQTQEAQYRQNAGAIRSARASFAASAEPAALAAAEEPRLGAKAAEPGVIVASP